MSLYETFCHHLKVIEDGDDMMERDQIAWLIGSIPEIYRYNIPIDCPKIAALIKEMEPCRTVAEAMLRVASYINVESSLGFAADALRKLHYS